MIQLLGDVMKSLNEAFEDVDIIISAIGAVGGDMKL